eukprot:scaffold805_cov165-Amphora_coffeaeformis.AAC.2
MLKQQDLSPETREFMMKDIIDGLAVDAGEMVSRVTPEMKERHRKKLRRERQRRAAEEGYRSMVVEMEMPDPRDHVKKMEQANDREEMIYRGFGYVDWNSTRKEISREAGRPRCSATCSFPKLYISKVIFFEIAYDGWNCQMLVVVIVPLDWNSNWAGKYSGRVAWKRSQ